MAPAIGGTGGERRGAIEGDGTASPVLGHRVEIKRRGGCQEVAERIDEESG